MTEQEWPGCIRPGLMLEYLKDNAGERKLRLFACACCRAVPHLLDDEEINRRVAFGELMADSLSGGEHSLGASRLGPSATHSGGRWDYLVEAANAVLTARALTAARDALRYVGFAARGVPVGDDPSIAANLLRDIVGNPFRPPRRDHSWLTPTVTSLCRSAYDERSLPEGHLDPLRLPILADALEDAGCSDEVLLSHLRGSGPHVRGCWALDLLLGQQ